MKTSYQYFSRSKSLELILKPESEEEYSRFVDLDIESTLQYVCRLAKLEFGDTVQLSQINAIDGLFRYRISTEI